ncbi:odorant receptor 9a-like [Cotesia glomerata]|uniref:odorant receptor 9a-like n=1 Tax=Cotesia glomerata TaxID=32391 RepID=UPI001D006D12|nr:odorant receptor 9a-like [Cotesia glomerata]
MVFFNNPDWRMGKLLLCSFGAWPSQSYRTRRFLSISTIFIVQSIFVLEIIKLVTVWNSIEMVTECLPMLSLHIVANIKMSNCLINLKKIKVLLNHIESDYQSDLSKSEVRTLLHDRHFHKKIITVYVIYIYAIAGAFAAIPAITKLLDILVPLNESRPKQFFYQAEYFVNQDEYSTYIYIHGYLTLPFPMTICVAYDFLYSACGHHVCSMFKITGDRLKNIDNISLAEGENFFKNSDQQDKIYKSLIECIKMQKLILSYIDCYERIFSISLFLVVGVNMFSLCFTSLQSLIIVNQLSDAFSYMFYAFGELVHLFLLNYQGQNIINHSENFYNSAFQANWHNFSLKSKKLYILIIMRSSDFAAIRAGKLIIMSSNSFSSILKTSVSYLMVFNSLR